MDQGLGLHRRTRVYTGEGPKEIFTIVKEMWSGRVKSTDSVGNIVWKKVTGWYETPSDRKEWYKIFFLGGKSNGTVDIGTIVSGNHLVLTKRGYIAVQDLREDDLVATGQPVPGPRAEQGLQGTLLGDGSINNKGMFKESHSIKQKEYLQWKIKLFAPHLEKYANKHRKQILGQERYNERSDSDRRSSTTSFYYALDKSYYFHDLRKKWYPNGVKRIPRDLHQTLDFFGLAIWYMDDGSYSIRRRRVSFALGKATIEEVEYLQGLLKTFGFESQKSHRSRGSWQLRITGETAEGFLGTVAKYVPESMRYKLDEEASKTPFDSLLYEPEEAKTGWRRVGVIQYSPRRGGQTKYSIDVQEAHNFSTPGGIVHC